MFKAKISIEFLSFTLFLTASNIRRSRPYRVQVARVQFPLKKHIFFDFRMFFEVFVFLKPYIKFLYFQKVILNFYADFFGNFL